MAAVADPERTAVDLAAVRLALRRRAARKVMRASRIATLLLADLSNDAAREEMRLSVDAYRRARGWLRAAIAEARMSPELLCVEEALRRYAERHVEGTIRVGLLRQAGVERDEIQQRLGITRDAFDICWEWYRDALVVATVEDD